MDPVGREESMLSLKSTYNNNHDNDYNDDNNNNNNDNDNNDNDKNISNDNKIKNDVMRIKFTSVNESEAISKRRIKF